MATSTVSKHGWLLEERDEEEALMENSSAVSAAQPDVRVPIVGYEIMEQRPRFTVYKIHVHKQLRSWFVFRRYTDFIRLHERLDEFYPSFNVTLPGRRWLRNNFDHEFIEDRARGLQYFINTVMGHGQLSACDPVREFFCLDDPPGPYDSLEQARAYCQSLESQVADLSETVKELETELSATKSQLKQARVQQKSILATLQAERALNSLGEDDVEVLLTSKRRHSCGSRLHNAKQTHVKNKQEIETLGHVANNRTVDQTDSGRDSGIAYSTSDSKSDDDTHGEPMLENVAEDDGNESYWDGNIEIVSHSSTHGIDQMKSANKKTENHDQVAKNDTEEKNEEILCDNHNLPNEDVGDDKEREGEYGDSYSTDEMQATDYYCNVTPERKTKSDSTPSKTEQCHPCDDSGIVLEQTIP